MSYQCTQRMRCINCRKEGHKAADCFLLDNDRGRGQKGDSRCKRGGPRGGRSDQNVYRLEEETLRLRKVEKKKNGIQRDISLLISWYVGN